MNSETNKKNSAKTLIGFIAILTILLVIAWLYLTFKVWSIFGFWRILSTTLVLIITGVAFARLSKAKRVLSNKIIYNPKEWPKFMQMLVSLLIGYYLYTVVQHLNLSSGDYIFSIAYLLITILTPMLWAIFILLRDRNDYIQFEGSVLTYRDNSQNGSYNLSQLESIETGKSLHLKFKDGSVATIHWSNMNFSVTDIYQIQQEIERFLPQKEDDGNNQ
jgi:hypothetical protein